MGPSGQNHRFHLEPVPRIAITMGMASIFGFIQGAHTAYAETASRYLVENGHRLPKTKGGWYWYHKRKNWVCLKSAVDTGASRAGKFGFTAGVFFGMEAAIDKLRGKTDALSTVITTVTCGWLYAKWSTLPALQTRRLVKNGLVFGMLFGVFQDCMIALRGGTVWYLPFTMRTGTGSSGVLSS